MKNIIFIVLFLTISICICWTDILLTYETKEKNKTTVSETKIITTTNGYKQINEKGTVYAAPSYLTYKYVYKDPETKTNYTAVKVGKEIQITGTLNGKPENKIINLENKRWFQSWDMALMYYMTTDLDVFTFWCLRADTIELFEFEIKPQARKTITIKGKNVVTQKVHIGLAGFLSIFWGGIDYWVRISDSIIVRWEMDDIESILISTTTL